MKITKLSLLHLLGLMLLAFNACKAVKIKSVVVPPTYYLDADNPNPEPLILDCIYDTDEKEDGFVIQWFLNNIIIYQWIAPRTPHALGTFKGRVDLNYTVSDERLQKHRALYINKPSASDSGEYACKVQTFQSNDKKVAKMQVITEDDTINVTYHFEKIDNEDTVKVVCTATNKLPTMTFSSNDEDLKLNPETPSTNNDEINNFEVSTTAILKISDIKDDTTIKCILKMPGTNYHKQKYVNISKDDKDDKMIR